jgi:tRNA dimethylallyltransferase
VRHLEGRISLDQAVHEIKRDTRRYAKRQLIWFRADPECHWVAADDPQALRERLRQALRACLWGGSTPGL